MPAKSNSPLTSSAWKRCACISLLLPVSRSRSKPADGAGGGGLLESMKNDVAAVSVLIAANVKTLPVKSGKLPYTAQRYNAAMTAKHVQIPHCTRAKL